MENRYAYDQRNREIWEAIQAGEKALGCLKDARRSLESAGNWGLVDIFGGNFISGLMKHSKIDDAKRSMNDAKRALNIFQKELRDVNEPNLQIGIDNFITFADFFFDGILVDVLVQSKISKAKEQVDDAIDRVERMLTELQRIQG